MASYRHNFAVTACSRLKTVLTYPYLKARLNRLFIGEK